MRPAKRSKRYAGVTDRLWDLSSDLMTVTDMDGRLLAVNDAWTVALGWRKRVLLRASVLDYVHPSDCDATNAELARLASGAPTQRFENRLRRSDGSYRTVSWRASPGGRLIYAIGRDITERLEREAALRQAQKMEAIGQLTGGIAHDFNNLLTVIRSSLEFLQQEDLPAERRRRYMSAMTAAVERATKLTGQLLAFARRQRLEPEVFDVAAKIDGISELVRQLVGPLVDVTVLAPDVPCRVEADPSQFETAVMNLVVNARDAMDGRGWIVIELKPAPEAPKIRGQAVAGGPFVSVSVRDSGSGIEPEHLGRIFEPFFTTKPLGKGTGLGLSQVYGFAKQSGGDVDVRSALGQGAEITLYLPSHALPPEPAAPPEDEARSPTRRAARVLLVEDNDQVGAFADALLRDLGYQPVWVRNADEALHLLLAEAGGFDVVFSDVVMPGLSGFELAELLRDRMPHLPVILTSGYSASVDEGGSRGISLLAKPYTPAELSRAIEEGIAEAQVQAG